MENVILEKNGHVSKITINRPKALNALSTDVLKDLEEAVNTVKNDDDTYCLIITGAGDKSFVAGADIAEMKDKTVEEAAEYGAYGNKIFREIETLHCPVIAAVNGFALGGGCELAMSCDIRVAADNAVFGQPEVGLGITPGFGGTQRLARLVGMGQTLCAAKARDNAKAAFWLCEGSVVRSDADITCHADLTSAAKSKAVDSSDRYLAHIH